MITYLNKTLNIINVLPPSREFDPFDYWEINPFDLNGNLMPQMNVVINIPTEWDGQNPYVIYVPPITTLPTFNFSVNFTTYFDGGVIRLPINALVVGNDYDNWQSIFLDTNNTMTWTPVAVNDQSLQTDFPYGTWLVDAIVNNGGIRPIPVEPTIPTDTSARTLNDTPIYDKEFFRNLRNPQI